MRRCTSAGQAPADARRRAHPMSLSCSSSLNWLNRLPLRIRAGFSWTNRSTALARKPTRLRPLMTTRWATSPWSRQREIVFVETLNCRARSSIDRTSSSEEMVPHGWVGWDPPAHVLSSWIRINEYVSSLKMLERMKLLHGRNAQCLEFLWQRREFTPTLIHVIAEAIEAVSHPQNRQWNQSCVHAWNHPWSPPHLSCGRSSYTPQWDRWFAETANNLENQEKFGLWHFNMSSGLRASRCP